MPTTTRTVYLTDENGNPLIDEKRNLRTLSFSLMQGYSYRLVERASIVSATYAQVVGYSTATGQTISGVENASEFDVGDFGIVQYAISDRNNTIGYVTCKVTAVGTDSLTVNGIGISVSGADGADGKDGAPGADGASGVTDVTAGTPTEQDGYTVTPVTFNFEQGNSKTVNIQAKNGEGGGAGVQQNAIINRTASVETADENSPDFVENNEKLFVKKTTGYVAEVSTLKATLPSARIRTSAATAHNGKIYIFGGEDNNYSNLNDIIEFDAVTQSATKLELTLPSKRNGTSAATAPNGKIYIFGGYGGDSSSTYLDDIIEFDPIAQSVVTIEATLPSARRYTSAATAHNGKIYVFGGKGISVFNDIVEFDPISKTVTTLRTTLPNAISFTSAATAPNGKIYIFGGSGNSVTDDVIEFDPITQTVITLETTLPTGRDSTSAATAHNGKIYVFGGAGTADILEFDPITQAVITFEASMPNATVSTSAATAPNNKIYVFGGGIGSRLDDIVEFDPAVAQYAYSQVNLM